MQNSNCTYFAVRRCPSRALRHYHREIAVQWDVSHILAIEPIYWEALYDHTSGYRYFMHLIHWEDFDMLDAFDVPYLTADEARRDFTLVRPQTMNNNDKLWQITLAGGMRVGWEAM